MRVAVDLTCIRPDHINAGIESFIKNLMDGWVSNGVENDFIFYIEEDLAAEYKQMYPTCNFRVDLSKSSIIKRRMPFIVRKLMFSAKTSRWATQDKVDILYYPTAVTGLSRKGKNFKICVTSHDIAHRCAPDYFSTIGKLYYDISHKHTFKVADRIISITDYVKGTLNKEYGKYCKDKVETIYDPIDFEKIGKVSERTGSADIVSVSSVSEHKNYITLVKAFELIKDKHPNNLLIIGNDKTITAQNLREYIKSHNLSDRVYLLGKISDEDLKKAYEHCILYVTASLYEGFGMTPIEALGRGITTITSTSTSLPEVTMGYAHHYSPTTDEHALAELMDEILSDPDRYKVNPEIVDKIRETYAKETVSMEYYNFFDRLVSGN